MRTSNIFISYSSLPLTMCCKAFLAFWMIFLVQPWTLCMVTATSFTSNITDQHSLIAFKSAIEIDPNNVLANNWTLDTNFCNWYGVSCSKRRQRVTALELIGMGLVGPISPQLGNLSFLTVLNLKDNGFHGHVIDEIGHLSRLTFLRLSRNNLKGEVPSSLTLCRKLDTIFLSNNRLTGMLPKNLSTLPLLRNIYLGNNSLTGKIPASFGNMSTLEKLGLEINEFRGTVPNDLAFLPSLRWLYLGQNYLVGTIPPSLFNISSLEIVGLDSNSLTGGLPKDISFQLPNMITLAIGDNKLSGAIPSYWYNASRLTFLAMEWNNFTGTLPTTLPLSLQRLSLTHCNLHGEIPKGITTLKNLTHLYLTKNRLSGIIPPTIKGMQSLQLLGLGKNELNGPIPGELCYLRNLGVLYLDTNRLSGSIPACIGDLIGLQEFVLADNELNSMIPRSLWTLDQLWNLNLSLNLFHGDIGNNLTTLKHLTYLDLSRNQLSGNIPDSLGSLLSLTYLDMSFNSFFGPIPKTFGNLISLANMNLSSNNLSGQIPMTMEALTHLNDLNLSSNKLSGEIPARGPFVNFTAQSFMGNLELCGESISKPCIRQDLRKSKNTFFPLTYIIPITVVVLIAGALLYVYQKRKRNNLPQNPERAFHEQIMISYHELSHGTNGFSESNFLGSGGFGKVYKGILFDGTIVAVKLLNLTVDGAIKSFDAECKVLRTVRHRNLVKIISTCTNPDLRALILEYIPNGSLEKWLYSHNYCLSFLQRVNIMIDVGVALDYLHFGQSEQVIHCDLKPGNVLLDEDMVAHVGDFGIAKILAANKDDTLNSTLGSFGYIAPVTATHIFLYSIYKAFRFMNMVKEYGAEGRVSTRGDTFSFGIMLLETFTRKRPTDYMFSEDLSLRQWVSSSVDDGILNVVDENLLNENVQENAFISFQSNLLAVLELGLGCSRGSPEQRYEMKYVVAKLNKIKFRIISEERH